MPNERALLDLVGVGFGPAGLSVAVALDDRLDRGPVKPAPINARFLEQAANADWQPNLLLPGSDIQHHFLRDYATPVNPRSRFTFPSYLVDTGRFFPFTLMGGYVSRQEWSAYTRWTAERVSVPVSYNMEVLRAEPVLTDGKVTHALVTSRDTARRTEVTHLASNLLISVGHAPYVPPEMASVLGDRVFHSCDYLPRISDLAPSAPLRFAVIGAGQNAGEIVLDLAARFPQAQIHSLVRNSGFRLYNLGHFSNEAYFPAETDYFYALDASQRRRVFQEVYSTNYACVDPDVSTALYRSAYEDQNWGPGRLHMHKRTNVDALAQAPGGGYRLSLREVNLGTLSELDADVVILCTGYREPRLPRMLEPFRPHITFDEVRNPAVSRAFRIEGGPECEVGLYLNGITEWRHGINSATSFSTMAVKADQIVTDLASRIAAQRGPDDPHATRLQAVPVG
jgi:L-ornithine N5-oxygenase